MPIHPTLRLSALAALLLCATACAPPSLPFARLAGLITAGDLDEVSGFAASREHDDVLWAIEDSGNPTRLYALSPRGRVLARYKVDGAKNVDWEDLASFDLDGKHYLLVADTGDNGGKRRNFVLHVFEEPKVLRNGMLKNLNGGRPAEGDLQVGQLLAGDVVYVDGDLRGVVRRGSSRLQFYWLQGDLNLDRIELAPNGDGRYKVVRAIDVNATPVLRTRSGGTLAAAVPASGSAERKSLQDQYADGREVADSLKPVDLRQGDTLYTGQGAALVVRRVGGQLARFWLTGSLDLGQIGLQSQGGNAYKVLSDTIK